MIEFEVKSKTQPIGKRKGQTVYFAQPVSQHHLTNKMVVDRIVRETSLSAGDVSNALISLGAIVRDAFEFEERNNIWNTPYLFNAKEFDEETGLYYYGARYYDPRLSLWMSTDPMQEKYMDNKFLLYI
nr:RHS repeat-associated core domain-containing protein [Prevotella sp.]